MRRDAIFYQIFKRFPGLFFELIEHNPDQVRGYRFESVEVKEPTFRIDGVFLPPSGATPRTIFFAEVQFQKDQTLYHRFFAEIFLYLYRNQTSYDDWYGVLLFPTRGLEPDASAIHRSLLESAQVQCLYLDELPSNTLSLELMQLMIEPQEQTIQRAQQLIVRARQETTSHLSSEEIIDLIATIAVYKFANLSRAEVEAMLGLSVEQTRIYQEAKAEGREEGREEILAATVPLLLKAGMTIEQIAEQLQLSVAFVQQIVDRSK